MLAVGEFVTVPSGSVSNDRIFTIKVNDHPGDYLSPHALWDTHLVGYVYEQGTPWDCHGQDIDSPHIDTNGYIAEMNDTGATLYTTIEENETRRTLNQLIRFGGNIDIYDHDAFASWAGTVTNHDFRECIRWSPRQEIKEGFMQDACTRVIVTKRLNIVTLGRKTGDILPILSLTEVRGLHLSEAHNRITQRVRRNRATPQPLIRALHISHTRTLGARISVLVIRAERLDLLIVRETPSAKTLFQQRGLRLGRYKRDTLCHLTDYHHNSPLSITNR